MMHVKSQCTFFDFQKITCLTKKKCTVKCNNVILNGIINNEGMGLPGVGGELCLHPVLSKTKFTST